MAENISISPKALQDFIHRQSDKASDLSDMTAREFIARFQKYAEQERQEAFNKKIRLSKVEYDGTKDPFRGTRARPKKKAFEQRHSLRPRKSIISCRI